MLHGVEDAAESYDLKELGSLVEGSVFTRLISTAYQQRYYDTLDEAMATCERFILDLHTEGYYVEMQR